MCRTGARIEGEWHAVQGLGTESTDLGLNESGSDVQYRG